MAVSQPPIPRMFVSFQFDDAPFREMAEQMNGAFSQFDYAMSRTLNEALVETREVMVRSTWPSHVTQRNVSFLSSTLRMAFSSKNQMPLRASIYSADSRRGQIVERQAVGGTVRPKRSRHLAIPLKEWVRRGARGVYLTQREQYLIATTPKRALRILPQGLFIGEGGRLHLKYSYKGQTTQREQVPLYETFHETMATAMRTGFQYWMAKAMATRKPGR
jgi:hypothetical protein